MHALNSSVDYIGPTAFIHRHILVHILVEIKIFKDKKECLDPCQVKEELTPLVKVRCTLSLIEYEMHC